jgi:uncharacterized protein YecE (DUF72 family)
MRRSCEIQIGTSAFTAAGWEGVFYPEGIRPAECLAYYSRYFSTVEVDSTYYRIPSAATMKRWYEQTPPGFEFALKMVQTVTHEKVLVDCDVELKEFFAAADPLKEKLGPILFQFPYFGSQAFGRGGAFFARLESFLKSLPGGYRFAFELRNKSLVAPRLLDALRERGFALALIDHPYMYRPGELFSRFEPITGDFAYVRLLGDRHGIERTTKRWDKEVVDRTGELGEWAEIVRKIEERRIKVYVYVNNHFAGHAPATARQLARLLGIQLEAPFFENVAKSTATTGSLFP